MRRSIKPNEGTKRKMHNLPRSPEHFILCGLFHQHDCCFRNPKTKFSCFVNQFFARLKIDFQAHRNLMQNFGYRWGQNAEKTQSSTPHGAPKKHAWLLRQFRGKSEHLYRTGWAARDLKPFWCCGSLHPPNGPSSFTTWKWLVRG